MVILRMYMKTPKMDWKIVNKSLDTLKRGVSNIKREVEEIESDLQDLGKFGVLIT